MSAQDILRSMNNLRWLRYIHENWHYCIALDTIADAETKVPPTDTTATPGESPVGASSTLASSTIYGTA